MDIKALLDKRLEKKKLHTNKEYEELGLYGSDYAPIEYDDDDDYDAVPY